MNNQQVAALLEIISFFFVGLDLYGKERLTKMQEGILNLSNSLYSKITNAENFEWNKNRNSKFLRVVYVASGLIEVVWVTVNIGQLLPSEKELGDAHWTLYVFIGFFSLIAIVIFFGVIMGAILVSTLLIVAVTIVSARLLNYFLRLIIWAFRLYKIEGVFLFIGTILFIVSKYVQLF